MQFDSRKTILSPTGSEVNLYIKQAEGMPRGVVQINHGIAEHAARYVRFADFLSRNGFSTYVHDHRGHGYTKAPGAPLGSFGDGGKNAVLGDVVAIYDLIKKEMPGIPVIVFGHSMGALITMNFVLQHSDRVAGAAIWNGNFTAGIQGMAAKAVLAWERFRLGSDVPSRLLPRLTFREWARKVSDGRTSFDWLSRDQAEADLYASDPLCGWNPSVSMWRDVFDFIFAGADDRNFSGIRRDLPINLVGGAKDPATDFGKAVEHLANRMRRMGFSNLVSTIYPETRHESLNELNRDLIMENFAGWAEATVQAAGPRPAG